MHGQLELEPCMKILTYGWHRKGRVGRITAMMQFRLKLRAERKRSEPRDSSGAVTHPKKNALRAN